VVIGSLVDIVGRIRAAAVFGLAPPPPYIQGQNSEGCTRTRERHAWRGWGEEDHTGDGSHASTINTSNHKQTSARCPPPPPQAHTPDQGIVEPLPSSLHAQ